MPHPHKQASCNGLRRVLPLWSPSVVNDEVKVARLVIEIVDCEALSALQNNVVRDLDSCLALTTLHSKHLGYAPQHLGWNSLAIAGQHRFGDNNVTEEPRISHVDRR